MSDFILKLWPKTEIAENKSATIKSHLKAAGLIGEDVNHWNGKASQATQGIKNYLEYDFEDR